MKLIRFDSVGGASGDMILGALIGLGADHEVIVRELGHLLPGHFTLTVEEASSHGIRGVRAVVTLPEDVHDHEGDHDHGHDHHAWSEIRALIEKSTLPEPVKESSIAVFSLLAEVEGRIHGCPPEEVYFHEVGAVDSIVDIVGSCLAFYLLEADAISLSAIPTGVGTFQCEHGILPIPAPATAELLKHGLTVAPSDEPFELLTPTGAALLAAWPKRMVPGSLRVTAIANSFGQRELLYRPNLLRAMLFEAAKNRGGEETVEELACNLDDCSGEVIGFLTEQLLAAGAHDVWTEAIQMKKQRPGVKLCVLSPSAEREAMLKLIFRESTTLGVRITSQTRWCLARQTKTILTSYGPVRVKIARDNDGTVLSVKPEYEDCRKIAEEHKVPLKEVLKKVEIRAEGKRK